ncbi:hypothetical protein ABFA07_014804 [Porites harrisoni]
MDSKRLFIFIALWLFLSCVLLDHADGFTLPRKRKKQQQRKRDPNDQLSLKLREMVGLVSQIWAEPEVQAPRNRTSLNSTASPYR